MEEAGFLGSETMLAKLKEHWVPRLCSSVPLAVWHCLLNVKLVVPFWHVVSDRELPHISGLYSFRNTRQFKADLDFFLRWYTPVTLQDVICHLHGDSALPTRCVLFTFDDGFREVHDVIAPLLKAKGAPAVFLLITSVIDNGELCHPQKKSLVLNALATGQGRSAIGEIDRLLTLAGVPNGVDTVSRIRNLSYRQRHVLDDLGRVLGCDFAAYLASTQPYLASGQVQALIRQGFAIGAHSVDHPLYAELTLEEQLLQTRESVRWLSDRFQINCESFAFPYRDNGVSLDFFQAVFGDGRLNVSFGTGGLIPHAFPYNLPRFAMERTDLPAGQILAGQFGRRLLRRKGNTQLISPLAHT